MRRTFLASLLGAAGGVLGALVLGGPAGRALARPPREGWPPDPPAVASKKHWVFEVIVKQGVPSLGKVSEVTLKKAEGTARVMGRYAVELYVGDELLDRLRFNVPLGGDGPREGDDQPGRKRPQFRVNTRMFVRMADSPRATRVRLVDRATAEIKTFVWPPGEGGKLASADAPPDGGSGDAGGGLRDAGAADAARDAGRHDPEAP